MGSASVVVAFYLDMVKKVTNIVPAVFLEVGAGIFLFSFLFWAERRIVRREVTRQTKALIEALSRETVPEQLAEPDGLNDLAEMYEKGGPVEAALSFVEAMAEGRYEDAWALADDDWRLCRAQSWLWNNQSVFGSDLEKLDELAAEIAAGPSDSKLWRNFRDIERRQFREVWRDYRRDRVGAASRRRRIARDYELVIITLLGEFKEGFVVRAPTLLGDALTLVVHQTPQGHRVASHVAEAPPRPGWPPAWWSRNDPVIEALYEQAG